MQESIRLGDTLVHVGNEVSIDSLDREVDFTVDQINRYVSSDDEWFEISGIAGGERVRVEQVSDRYAAIQLRQSTLTLEDTGLTEDDLVRMDERRTSDESFGFDGATWFYKESQEIGRFENCGPHGEGYYNWDFTSDAGDRLLSVEKREGEPFEIVVSQLVPLDDVRVSGDGVADSGVSGSGVQATQMSRLAGDSGIHDAADESGRSGIVGQTLTLLFFCVAGVVGLVVVVGLMSRGLDPKLIQRAQDEQERFAAGIQEFAAMRESVEGALGRAGFLFDDKLQATWKRDLDEAGAALESARPLSRELHELLNKGERKSSQQVEVLIERLADARYRSLQVAATIESRTSDTVETFGEQLAQTWQQALTTLDDYQAAAGKVAQMRQRIEQALNQHPDVFQPREHDKKWPIRLDAARSELDRARPTADELTAAVEANKPETREHVIQLTQKLAGIRTSAVEDVEHMAREADELVKFKLEREQRLAEIQSLAATIAKTDIGRIDERLRQAVADWPEKKTDLEGRVKRLQDAQPRAARIWQEIDSADAVDLQQLMVAAQQLTQIRSTLSEAQGRLPPLIEQLYWSWDRILTDMQIQEGSDVKFRHKFRTVRLRALAPEGEQARNKVTEEWKFVTKSQWESNKANLGMVVAHKPAGKYDHEAIQLIQPAGYAYICPPQQQRNSYGSWHQNGGSSFWRFYGQYAFLRTMMGIGGGSQSPINGIMWNDYDRHRRSGRTWYGQDEFGKARYGSDGIVTRRTHAGSQFVTSNGFRNTQYVKSGGTYRGSRFTPSTKRYSGSRYQSSSSSRSRSFSSSPMSRSRSGSRGGK